MKKKLVATILAAVMMISVTACGTEESGKATSGTGTTGTEASSAQIADSVDAGDGFYVNEADGGKTTDPFSIWVGWTSECPDDTRVQQVMREELGMDYRCEFMQSDDVLTTVNLKLSSGANLPDIMIFPYNPEVMSALVGSGRVMKLNDIFQSEKLANIAAIDQRIKDFIRDENGDMWYIPGWYAMEYDEPWGGWTLDAWWVRKDLMEVTGVTEEDLTTIEGMEEALRKFSQCKDENGKPVVPLSFIQGSGQERIILSTFGLDTKAGVSRMPAVMKKGDEFVFLYDNPAYKEAYKWMNRMYNEGLIDLEVTTIQAERFKEKLKGGQVAVMLTDAFSGELFNDGYEEDSVTFEFQPYACPKVEDVERGYTSYVDPNPRYMVFINNDTQKLNPALNFLNWVNEAEPIRQQEVNEGPKGILWDFTDGERWSFDKEYVIERNSGDQARVDACTPQLYQFAAYSNKWYPWFEQDLKDVTKGQELIQENCKYIGNELQNHRSIQDIDRVKLNSESIVSENLESLNAVVKEYTAKMIMAKSDQEFENAYSTFLAQLDMRADWEAMKEEWLAAYQEQFGE